MPKRIIILFRKLNTFVFLDKQIKIILIEAYMYLAWARFQKKLPFSKLLASMDIHMAETSLVDDPINYDKIRAVSGAIQIMSRYTFWESMCLVRAIAGMRMLYRRKVESTLYLGTGKDESGKMIAHAWLRSGTFFVSGAEEKDKFTIVGKFASRIM